MLRSPFDCNMLKWLHAQVDGDADSEEEDEGMGNIDVEAPAAMVDV